MRPPKRPIQAVSTWVRRQPPKVKAFLAVVSGMVALVLLRAVVHDHDNLFVAAEAVHAIGISVLIYKLMKERTCAGLSLKSQELTAIFLAVRLYCSFVMEYDIHTILDMTSLATTSWVIYMIRFKLRSSYMEDKDNFALYYVVGPCAILALLIHPSTSHHIVNRIAWAFCVYLEAVSVLPQLRVMQNTKIVEPFTAHYVFALGVARFLSCAHWVLQVLDTRGHLLVALGYGLWPSMVLISEIVQTFILADFCYYYVKSLQYADLYELNLKISNRSAMGSFIFMYKTCIAWSFYARTLRKRQMVSNGQSVVVKFLVEKVFIQEYLTLSISCDSMISRAAVGSGLLYLIRCGKDDIPFSQTQSSQNL
ncbi:UNVERIFIED_CONTAM: ER lumen protein-retaining receptor [Sesamum radiatum]|uniref:ER lumen protein-retaining receptor n=1 Tax=Sesamum radiatum TaxID=300843 RepID=A0AAW2U6I6_SESRA